MTHWSSRLLAHHLSDQGGGSLSFSFVIYGEPAECGGDLGVSSLGCVLVAEGGLGC